MKGFFMGNVSRKKKSLLEVTAAKRAVKIRIARKHDWEVQLEF